MKKLLAIVAVLVLLTAMLSPAAVSARPVSPRVIEAVFIHYESPAKGKPSPPTELPKEYDKFLLLGPAWDLSKYPNGVPYIINPTRAPLGAEQEVLAGFEAWDAATSAELFNDTPTIDYNSYWGNLDGKNNISWQVISGRGIIAATWLWIDDKDASGGFSAGDEILETDMVFNASMKFGIDQDGEGSLYKLTRAYDIRDIATHEAGHVVGLDDLYETQYSEITMYGYSSKGETKKISLEAGDVNGTKSLYGN